MESTAAGAAEAGREEIRSQVDPFLVEALENPRHRLTVLRMEIDTQRFIQNPDQYQFEFQNLPTSYLRCAAHRVAQHYGLQTMALENSVGGLGSRVIARKTPNSKFPPVCLSEVPVEQTEKIASEQFKIVMRKRPVKASQSEDFQQGIKRNEARSVEEREKEYDIARARIFNGSSGSEMDGMSSAASADGRGSSSGKDELEHYSFEENGRTHNKDVASRVAIFRDTEKDRTDPDYDRSYGRYVRGPFPCQNLGVQTSNILQHPFQQCDADISSLRYLTRNQTSFNQPSNPALNPYGPFGYNQSANDPFCMQWPSPAMMYAYSYEPFRRGNFQVPSYQQPLSFDHQSNC